MCTGDVGSVTDFHVWNATRRVDHFAAKDAPAKPLPEHKAPRLVFGERPANEKKKKRKLQ